jgi:hypothetical protein
MEEIILKVLKDPGRRRKFGPKREEIKRGWEKLHGEAFHNLSFSVIYLCFFLNLGRCNEIDLYIWTYKGLQIHRIFIGEY